jgi:hypothetical protein
MAKQKNLWTLSDLQEFYNSHKSGIDSALIGITRKSTSYFGPDNYLGMTSSDGKPHRLNAVREYLINHRKIYEVCYNYRNTKEVIACRQAFPALETLISAFVFIESKYDNRANLKKPNPKSSYKGLVQIGSSVRSSYPDLRGNLADFSPIPTTTKYGLEPPTSIYNAYNCIERVISFLYRNISTFQTLAAGVSVNDRRYPFSGWALYLLWNQGLGGGGAIIREYIKNENAPYTVLSKTIQRNIRSNPFGGTPVPSSIGEWVERLRYEYNKGFYLACNNCVARVYKDIIEKSGGKVVGSQIQKNNFTCNPLSQADFKIKIGSFVKR